MKQFIYIIGISIIWLCLLYFFVEVYYHNPSESSRSSQQQSKPHPSTKLNIREKKKEQLGFSHPLSPQLNLTKRYQDTSLSFTPLMPITMGAKSLDHVFKEQPAVSTTPLNPPIKPKPYPVARKVDMSAADYKVARAEGMPWTAFAQHSMPSLRKGAAFPDDPNSVVCGADVEARLNQRLSEEELTWCQWALSPSGGQVKVGKSYGLLKGKDREKFEKFNCNNVAKGQNPSCDDVSSYVTSHCRLLMCRMSGLG